MHSKVILAETPSTPKKTKGRPRSISISQIEEPPKIEPIPIIEPQAVILEKKKRGRPPKKVTV
jgi:hypothetical protein